MCRRVRIIINFSYCKPSIQLFVSENSDYTKLTLPEEEFQILAGQVNACVTKATRYEIEEVISHPYYRGAGDSFDIALVKLTQPLPLAENSSIDRVQLSYFDLPDLTRVLFTGWGRIVSKTRSRNEV